MEKTYEFQVNLGFGKKTVSACGTGPNGLGGFTAPSVRMLLRKIIKKTGIRIEQVVLTFQPSPQP
jgi:hypothetical protein